MVKVIHQIVTTVVLALAVIAAGFIVVMSFVQLPNRTKTAYYSISVLGDPNADPCSQGKAFVDNRPFSIRFGKDTEDIYCGWSPIWTAMRIITAAAVLISGIASIAFVFVKKRALMFLGKTDLTKLTQ
jgi:hypothetical protein